MSIESKEFIRNTIAVVLIAASVYLYAFSDEAGEMTCSSRGSALGARSLFQRQ